MSSAAPTRPFTGTERLAEITAGPRGGYGAVATGEIVSANITRTS